MMTLLKMSSILIITLLMKTLNPVKMSILIMALSSFLFLLMNDMIASCWFPSIFYLLFMGGILIMFMILSSLMPNEKSMKMKIPITMSVLASFSPILMCAQNSMNQNMTQMKWFLQSSTNMELMILLILSYFLSFIFMIYKEKIPLRSSLCPKQK